MFICLPLCSFWFVVLLAYHKCKLGDMGLSQFTYDLKSVSRTQTYNKTNTGNINLFV